MPREVWQEAITWVANRLQRQCWEWHQCWLEHLLSQTRAPALEPEVVSVQARAPARRECAEILTSQGLAEQSDRSSTIFNLLSGKDTIGD